MAGKQTNEELRQEILKIDNQKEVNIHAAVMIAVFAGISSASAVLGTLAVAFLEGFRQDVELYWPICIHFCYPVITAIAIAYRKQMATVGIHIAIVLASTAVGGAGYAFTLEPVYEERHNCTPVNEETGDCDREVLVYLYVICGGVAAGSAVLGLLLSFCTCSNAMKRRARRLAEKEFRMQQEDERRAREIKSLAGKSRQPLSFVSAPAAPTAPTSSPPSVTTPATTTTLSPPVKNISVTATATQTGNGEAKEAKAVNGVTNGFPRDNVTTHL